jgi:hypothetical protein
METIRIVQESEIGSVCLLYDPDTATQKPFTLFWEFLFDALRYGKGACIDMDLSDR